MTKEGQRKMIHLFGLVYGLSNNIQLSWINEVRLYVVGVYIIILNHVAWLTCM